MRNLANVVALALFAAPGDAARAMAAAPRSTKDAAPPAANRFATTYQLHGFKPDPKQEFFAYKDGGGGQTKLAQCMIEIGKTGQFIVGAAIVKITDANGALKEVKVSWPSNPSTRFAGGILQIPEDANARNEWIDFSKSIVERFIAERRKQVEANGGLAPVAAAGKMGMALSDDDAKALGLI